MPKLTKELFLNDGRAYRLTDPINKKASLLMKIPERSVNNYFGSFNTSHILSVRTK